MENKLTIICEDELDVFDENPPGLFMRKQEIINDLKRQVDENFKADNIKTSLEVEYKSWGWCTFVLSGVFVVSDVTVINYTYLGSAS